MANLAPVAQIKAKGAAVKRGPGDMALTVTVKAEGRRTS